MMAGFSKLAERAVQPTVTFLLASFALALWLGLDLWGQEQAPQFSTLGLPGIAWYVLATLCIAWLVSVTCAPQLPMRTALWLSAALAPLAIIGVFLSSYYDAPTTWIVLALTALVLAALAGRALRAFSGQSQLRAVLVGLISCVLLWQLTDAANVNASVWYTPEEATAEDAEWVDTERTLYDQPARIDAALAHVARHDGSAPQAYMVGFAGVGEQRVFAGEIELAARVIGERYQSTGRTLLLVNDDRDLDSRPLATVTGLERALKGVAARMDREQDILFLVLSSHGSEDPAIAVSNASLSLNQLDATALSDALQASGIRWRVIIISACYSGGFIPPLRDDHTIVLTAAAADRTSFGCGSDRDLTYFGEAFFRDALPGAHSLEEAFDRANASLSRRESREHEAPSHPQAFFGSQMAARLREFEQRHRAPLRAGIQR